MRLRILLLGLVFAQPVWGAVDCTVRADAPNVLGRIGVARADQCFGGDNDSNPLAVRVLKIKSEQCKASTREELTELRTQLAGLSSEVEVEGTSLATNAAPEWSALTSNLNGELHKSTLELQDVEAISNASYWAWSDNHQSLQQPDGSFLVQLAPLIENSCVAGGPMDTCAAAIATAVRVIRVINLSHYLHQCAGNPRLEGVRKKLKALDAEWNDYFFKTRSQYIWELLLNSKRFKGRDDVFAEPPRDQVILAHPGVAYEYVGGGTQNETSYEAIVIGEIIGYNRFGSGQQDGRLFSGRPALGASIVATYSPDNTGDHLGYGVLFHVWNAYSLGVTRRDTGAGKETTYLLSADFMRIVLKPSEFLMKEFRGAGSPALQ